MGNGEITPLFCNTSISVLCRNIAEKLHQRLTKKHHPGSLVWIHEHMHLLISLSSPWKESEKYWRLVTLKFPPGPEAQPFAWYHRKSKLHVFFFEWCIVRSRWHSIIQTYCNIIYLPMIEKNRNAINLLSVVGNSSVVMCIVDCFYIVCLMAVYIFMQAISSCFCFMGHWMGY